MMVEDFEKNGFMIKKGLFSAKDIKLYVREFDKIVNQLKDSKENINARWGSTLTYNIEHQDSMVIHTHNVQNYSSVMLRMILHKIFLDEVEKIIGSDIVLHHTKLFEKSPKKGAAFPLHQDWSYFPTKNNTMIAAVIHLSNSTEEMGCFRIIPGSHKLGCLESSDGHKHNPEIHSKCKLDESYPVIANPGDVLFFHCCSLHGSMANTSLDPRKTILVQLYSGKDKIIKGNTHINAQLVLRGFNYYSTRKSVDVS